MTATTCHDCHGSGKVPGTDLAFVAHDPIERPKHYTSKDIEVIDIIEAWDMNFRLGNVIKYVLRHKEKNGLEDLKKARWYLDREIAKAEK